MNWYLTKLVFQIICGDGNHQAQFDEQLRLITADTKENAFQKAQSIGQQEQESFYNVKQQLVLWKFINVSELYKLSDMVDGAEICSRIIEQASADQYIGIVHQKADNIYFTQSHELLNLA